MDPLAQKSFGSQRNFVDEISYAKRNLLTSSCKFEPSGLRLKVAGLSSDSIQGIDSITDTVNGLDIDYFNQFQRRARNVKLFEHRVAKEDLLTEVEEAYAWDFSSYGGAFMVGPTYMETTGLPSSTTRICPQP